jgi:two-component system LytT family sensor kinase
VHDAAPTRASPWLRGAGVFGVWTLIGLFFTTQHYLNVARIFDGECSWRRSLLSTLPDWYLWAALSPIVTLLCRAWPVERGKLRVSIPVHVVAGLVLALVHVVLSVAVFMFLSPVPGHTLRWGPQLEINFLLSYHWDALTYAALAALSHARSYRARSLERARRAAELEATLARAQLDVLRRQLEPHFLFNALNAVAELIHSDPGRAEEMLIRLADLLRLSLKTEERQEVPLRTEIELLEKYLDVERARFADRLAVAIDVSPATLDAAVPTWILQPLVENAVRHGVARMSDRGRIEIRSHVEGSSLRLEVRDNGPGLGDAADSIERTGLSNTRARIARLYGDPFGLRLENAPGGGAVTVLELPYRIGIGD